jgi:electron transport complex protein RnfD
VLSEFLFNLIVKKKQTVGDLSAVVTGLLLALTLPAKAGIFECIVGSMFAIVVVKCLFGGIGCNFANPAITSRIFLMLSFATVGGGSHTVFQDVDLVGGATPLELVGTEAAEKLPSILDMLIGNRGGAIGETCAIALIIGVVYLIVRKVITWHTPVVYVGGVFLLSLLIKQDVTVALYEILGGGLLIGAFFMATDYVTTPKRPLGKVVFALGCAILTVLIRFYGVYPEGVSFAILIMNILTPFIDKLCKRKPFGGAKA